MARDLFATLDLNLLKTLLVLSQEQNMRKAADRLFVTQPAVSQALKKLRHHFGEELFIRTPTGMQPTSYTEHLVSRLAPLMDEISTVLNDREGFNPAQLEGTIRITLSSHISLFLSAKLFKSIHQAAPQASVHLTNWSEKSLENLRTGEYDLGVTLEIEQTSKEIMAKKLADDGFTGYVRRDHPLIAKGESVSLKELDGCTFATLIIPDWNVQLSYVEQMMKLHGYRSRVVFRSDQPAAIADAVRHSDMVFPASSFIDAEALKDLRSFRVRLRDKDLKVPLVAYYHQKNRRNPVTLWLTGLIQSILDER